MSQLFYTDLTGKLDRDLERYAQGVLMRLVHHKEDDAGIAIETFDEKIKGILSSEWQDSLKTDGYLKLSDKTIKLITKNRDKPRVNGPILCLGTSFEFMVEIKDHYSPSLFIYGPFTSTELKKIKSISIIMLWTRALSIFSFSCVLIRSR